MIFSGEIRLGDCCGAWSLPAIVAQLINLLYNLVDRVYIGHMPEDGALALTGVGVCLPIIMIVSAFAALVSNGGAPRASMAMGKGDYDEAEKILGNSVGTADCHLRSAHGSAVTVLQTAVADVRSK